MFLRFLLPGHYRVTLTIARTTEVIGVNSEVKDGKHILLWDFDGVPLERVKSALRVLQDRTGLSDIYVFQTRKDAENYHSFCLQSHSWKEVVAIIAATPEVDFAFFKWGVVRGHFTLRISPKGEEIPWQVATIPGKGEEDVTWKDLKSFTRYETRLKHDA